MDGAHCRTDEIYEAEVREVVEQQYLPKVPAAIQHMPHGNFLPCAGNFTENSFQAFQVNKYLSQNAKLTKVSKQRLQPKRRNQMKRSCSQQSSDSFAATASGKKTRSTTNAPTMKIEAQTLCLAALKRQRTHELDKSHCEALFCGWPNLNSHKEGGI